MAAFTSNALSKLCSEDQLALLDSIDQLRLQGINNYVSLPQIIVCGDQSSGKSSVLEAISGVSFPIKSNLCTRFPTELVLRRTPHFSARVSIIPHESRSESEQIALRNFHEELAGFADLPKLIESAKLAMGITPHGRAFAQDILRVEVTGPDRPHLTIVDLPGLIHSETKTQTVSDVELIKGLVQSYMKEARCIILAVVSAKNDFANQVVLKLAREADQSGNRTLGVITKPDTLVPGGESEALYVSLARNHQVVFRHGWHVLKNMDSEKGSWSLAERDAEEAEFFSSGAWASLPPSSLGIEKLRSRLSKVLLGQIASELPSLMSEMEEKSRSTQVQLEDLGDPRANATEQMRYLLHISQEFQALVSAGVGGHYINNRFFVDAKTEVGYQQRLRAIIQNLNEDFAKEMSRAGHYREITDEPSAAGPSGESSTAIKITRSEFITHIEHLLRRTRGRELPGTFNPMIVADLFIEQSRPWEAIVRRHVEKVWKAASRFVELVVAHSADPLAAKALQNEVVKPAMRRIFDEMRDKTTELLRPNQEAHPITYDHSFAEALENLRRERMRKEPERLLAKFFGVSSLQSAPEWKGSINLQALARALAASTEPEVKRSAASDALDCLNAYYKVALKRFIDDVAVEVIEGRLVSALAAILSPVSVFEMPADQVARIAGEPEEIRAEREQLTKQLEVLRSGLETYSILVPANPQQDISSDSSVGDSGSTTSDDL
ncbi:4aabc9d3-cb0e-4cab-b923-e71054945ea4 [Thermothielavioides terrestris]|uniref:4aabc9d3-cb0e-4cab-b923-e71054945ea4 n=1 Tax=Thermothielavioides terrestris TaxID=2587410 RepID=A0A446BN65_9PEZI|nr:4aabc9d3-cb0e-4cab-b923-e71054945ea4 [Thermothielavioides terrestris]